ncbi:MAG: response regulator transcription factor [Dehalococcoidales bacterium]|nr:response regulator transcription factor [Dehalococcoidales bacterium]
MRILLVDDARKLVDTLGRILKEQGYAVDTAFTAEEGENLARENPYDLIILDVCLPDKNGFEVCRSLRSAGIDVPILMMSGLDDVMFKTKGLNEGADDYLAKPFDLDELNARIRALLRREKKPLPLKLLAGDISIDTMTREAWKSQKRLELTNKEYAILEYLVKHSNTVITRAELENHVWNLDSAPTPNLLDVYIRKLRRKINGEPKGSMIQTVKGVGYKIRIVDRVEEENYVFTKN